MSFEDFKAEMQREVRIKVFRKGSMNEEEMPMKIRYGVVKEDQVCEVEKYLDGHGNFVHKEKERIFQLNTIPPETVTGYLNHTTLYGDDKKIIFEDSKIMNIHRVKYITRTLGIGFSSHFLPVMECADYSEKPLKYIPSVSYIYQNITTVRERRHPPFVQFEYLKDDEYSTNFPNRYIGIRPSYEGKIYYCEIRVHRGIYGIGLSPENPRTVGVGWKNPSIGYHGDNGMIYGVKGHTTSGYRQYEPYHSSPDDDKKCVSLDQFGYSEGSVIGIGMDFSLGKIFFTKNGVLHPHAAKMKMPEHHYKRTPNFKSLYQKEEEEEEEEDVSVGDDDDIDNDDEENKTTIKRKKKKKLLVFEELGDLLFPSVGCFPSLSFCEINSFEINLGEDTIKTPFMYDKMNWKSGTNLSHLEEDLKERLLFLTENLENKDFCLKIMESSDLLFFKTFFC